MYGDFDWHRDEYERFSAMLPAERDAGHVENARDCARRMLTHLRAMYQLTKVVKNLGVEAS